MHTSKVPAVTLVFWILKILATTLGETGGDAASMTFGLGYLKSTLIFAALFLVAVAIQIKAEKFHPAVYWLTIVATTTVGTTLADFADRSLGVGYTGGSLILLALLLLSLAAWYKATGSVAVESVRSPKTEAFYWITILFSQTLGTALGDWAADAGLGFGGGALFFLASLAIVAVLYWKTKLQRTTLFWAAFILTRPLGATLGDFFDKPRAEGGLELSRVTASLVLIAAMGIGVALARQQPAGKAH